MSEYDSTQNLSHIGVYIVVGDDANKTEAMRRLFDHPLFVTYIVSMEVPASWLQQHSSLKQEDAEEFYQYYWCLSDAKKRMPDNYVLIIKDNSTTNVSPVNLAEILMAACQNKTWQLCYLTKWQDRCDLYTDKVKLGTTASILAKTYSPHGCQAILFSPEGRNIVLNEHKMKNGENFRVTSSLDTSLNYAIKEGHLDATCIIPNLVTYDITTIRKDADYAKCQECSLLEQPSNRVRSQRSVENSGGSGWVWFLLVLGIILLLLWYLFMYRSRTKHLTYYNDSFH